MSDARAYDSEALPWLEAVENEDGPRAISARKMLVALVLVRLAAAVVAGTMFWIGRQSPAPSGGPELIRAERVSIVHGSDPQREGIRPHALRRRLPACARDRRANAEERARHLEPRPRRV